MTQLFRAQRENFFGRTHAIATPSANPRAATSLEAMYRFLLWLVPTLEKFPRSQKFTLGDRLQGAAMDTLEHLIEATYTRDRKAALNAANLGLQKVRMLCRLAHELRYLDTRRYAHAAREVDTVGRLVGGWMKTRNAGHADGTQG